jgi:hypothetical protein
LVYEEGKEYRSIEFQEVDRVKSRTFYGWSDDTEIEASASSGVALSPKTDSSL